jgi:hypothetical protein
LKNRGSSQLYLAPGYSLLASPAFLSGNRPFLLLSAINWVLAVVFLLGVYRWARRHIPTGALYITALSVVNIGAWTIYRRTLSEPAFMAGLVWLINLLEGSKSGGVQSLLRASIAVLLFAALVLTRQAAITVAGGLAAFMLIRAYQGRCSWRRAAGISLGIGIAGISALVSLAVYDKAMAAAWGTPTYLDQIVDPSASLANQVSEGLRLRISEVGRLTVPGMFKAYSPKGHWLSLNMAIYVPLFLVLGFAWCRLIRQSPSILTLTFPCYVALYVIWPFDQATRFMVPMLPVLMACLWLSLAKTASLQVLICKGLLAAHFLCAVGYWALVDLPRAQDLSRKWREVEALARLLPTQPGPILVSRLEPNVAWMIQFVVDRPVWEQSANGGQIGARIEWLITPADSKPATDFAPSARVGRWRIARRSAVLARGQQQKPVSVLEFRPIDANVNYAASCNGIYAQPASLIQDFGAFGARIKPDFSRRLLSNFFQHEQGDLRR